MFSQCVIVERHIHLLHYTCIETHMYIRGPKHKGRNIERIAAQKLRVYPLLVVILEVGIETFLVVDHLGEVPEAAARFPPYGLDAKAIGITELVGDGLNVVTSLPDGTSCKIILEKSTAVIGCDKLLCNIVVAGASVAASNASVLVNFVAHVAFLVAIRYVTTRERKRFDI